ncbi:hypothetical protein FO519_008493 [Halicephalobus sp. NKZ332]|nr:hypothetical protein FO519_008493 [Halicephalobus sp. NKZ332]
MSRIDGEGSLYPLLPPSTDDGGHDNSGFDLQGRKTGGQMNLQNPRSVITGSDFDRAVIAYPGEVLALMGSSGAGKTSLMNMLTQRNLSTVVTSGKIRINDIEVDKDTLRKLSAYVQQDDLFIGTMTVAEHLHFTALMKMGKNYSARERLRRVRMVMLDLNLSKCANTLIGNHRRGIKGISGGERKRLAFASEIMTSPPLLFCDEPTSGLDSHMARHTIEVLKSLATRKNMTIICTIHQPSSQVFALFDRVCFMAEGRTAFIGTIPEAIQHWKFLGDPVPEKSNPADHYVTSLAILGGKKYEESKKKVTKMCDTFLETPVGKTVFSSTKSDDKDTPDESLDLIWKDNDKLKEKTYQRYKATWFQQFAGLFKRSLLGNMRDPVVLQVRIFQTIVIALIMGFVYFNTEINQRTVMSINGSLFQVVVSVNFMFQFTAVHMFCEELPTFLREHQANLYRVLPYFLAINFAEAIQYTIYPAIFACITYWLSGYVSDVGAFLYFTLICILVTKTAISISYIMSCVFGVVSVAISVLPILVVPVMAFGGFFININSLPGYFVPLQYLTLGQIIYGGLMLICLGLTVISMFTPGWTRIQKNTQNAFDNQQIPDQFGIFQFSCAFPGENSRNNNCAQWFDDLPNYYKVVVGAMILAGILEIVALIWNLLTFCACCCKKHILHPLYGLALAVSILLAIAVAVFYVRNKDIIQDMNLNNITGGTASEVSYSFYLACAALAASIAAIFAGIFSACFADIRC